MEPLQFSPSPKTPEINFDSEVGILEIKGKIYPENPKEFFGPVLTWADAYLKKPANRTELLLHLDYINSSSNEYVFRICKLIENLSINEFDASITWKFESDDEDMMQLGEDYKALLKINFNLIAVN